MSLTVLLIIAAVILAVVYGLIGVAACVGGTKGAHRAGRKGGARTEVDTQ